MAEDEDETPDFDSLLEQRSGATEFDWDVEDIDQVAADTIDVLRFSLGGIALAVDGASVREIVGLTDITSIPGAPSHILGITLLKREVLGVLDLAAWLELKGKGSSPAITAPRLVVLESQNLSAAFIADTVDGIESWPEAIDSSSIPENVNARLRGYARSSRWAPGGVVMLLDVEKILNGAAVR